MAPALTEPLGVASAPRLGVGSPEAEFSGIPDSPFGSPSSCFLVLRGRFVFRVVVFFRIERACVLISSQPCSIDVFLCFCLTPGRCKQDTVVETVVCEPAQQARWLLFEFQAVNDVVGRGTRPFPWLVLHNVEWSWNSTFVSPCLCILIVCDHGTPGKLCLSIYRELQGDPCVELLIMNVHRSGPPLISRAGPSRAGPRLLERRAFAASHRGAGPWKASDFWSRAKRPQRRY